MDLRCFLCKDQIPYNNNDKTDFTEHMNNEHLADFGIDFLLASCLMDQEERESIQDVIGDKFQIGDKFNDQEILEDDIYEEESVEDLEYLSPTVTLSEQNYKSKSLANELIEDEEVGDLAVTEENVSILESILSHSIFSETDTPKQSQMVKRERKGVVEPILAEPGQSSGDGKVCPICFKEFPKNGPMRRHFEDIHQTGEFPCPGCQKMFTSKNKMSSHFSRHCNPNNINKKRKTL